jgi:precorrin-2 dehydrogenase/sirohydrochlorin ferrochelatase
METFPAFFPLAGRRIAIVGAGEAADAKARLFEGSAAEVVRLGEAEGTEPSAYAGVLIAFIAVEALDLAETAAAAARRAGVVVNVVDRPHLSDFSTPAIVARGAVVAAIGTGGAAPVLATRLREELEARWPEGLGGLAELFAQVRDAARARFPEGRARRAALRRLLQGEAAEAALAGDIGRALGLALAQLDAAEASPGKVQFLPCPAAPDLISLRALRALSAADMIVADDGAPAAVLKMARRDAPVRPLTSAADLAALAIEGATVVCLTAAPDPSLEAGVATAGASVERLA